MNIVADSFPLVAGDEVLLTDHEYGAVNRIWERAVQQSGRRVRVVELPLPFRSDSETVDAIFEAVTDRTRLIVVSHITSPTAVTLPVAEDLPPGAGMRNCGRDRRAARGGPIAAVDSAA